MNRINVNHRVFERKLYLLLLAEVCLLEKRIDQSKPLERGVMAVLDGWHSPKKGNGTLSDPVYKRVCGSRGEYPTIASVPKQVALKVYRSTHLLGAPMKIG